MRYNKIKLKEIAEINMGQSPSGSSYNNSKKGVAFLQGNRTFGFLYPSVDTWTTEPKKIGKKGSILMSVRAPVGDLNIANEDICIGRGLCSIEMKNGNNEYLFYLLKNSINEIKLKSTGTVFDSVNKKELEDIEIIDFSKEYQDRISKVLFDIDRKIQINTHTNDNLLKFGLGLITEEMKKQSTKELRNIIKFIKGKKPINISEIKKDKYLSYLTIANLNNQENLYASTENVIIADNDLLMVMDGASSGDVYYSDYGIVGSTLAKIDIIDTSYNQASIYFILKYFSEYIKSKNTGSAIPHTDKEIVYKLVIPDIDNKKKYENILKNILQLNKQNKILEQLRDTLLPKLMNGEIDLDKIEI